MRAPKTTRPASRRDARTLAPRSPLCAGTIPCCVMRPLPRGSPSVNSTPPCAPSGPYGSSREILAGLEEFDLRPAFLGQAEIDPRRREVHQFTRVIDGEIVIGLFSKLAEPLLIADAHPSRRGHIDRLEYALHAVFVLQAKGHDLELQLADGAENQIVVAQRLEELRGALLAELRQSFLQGLHPQRVFQNRAAKHFRGEIRNSREG